MGRKGIKPKLLMCAVALSTAVTGLLGSFPLPVKAAEGGNYTVTFEAYEGTCETESISVPKGESLTLPEASYEGHFLESWMEVTEDGNVETHRAIGRPGDIYTPERDLWLYANWKIEEGQGPEAAESYEARIGGTYYVDIESAFENAQEGDTITVLKDCSASKTLVASVDNLTLTSEDAEDPAVISRDGEFAGKNYGRDAGNVLLGISGGSLATQDIIFDGGAELDDGFNNSGQVWDSPLIYVKGSYAIGTGTVLQNNYNTDYSESHDGARSVRTAGALEVAYGGSLTMDGGLIKDCYTLGAGGGIQVNAGARAEIMSGTASHCHAVWGGALSLMGPAEISGMELYGNEAESSGGALWSVSELELSDCTIRDNQSGYDGGGITITSGGNTVVRGCTFTGNSAGRGSAIHVSGGEGTKPPVIRDCVITGNRSDAETPINGSAINYMGRAGLILDGEIVMDDNTFYNGIRNDIVFWYDDAEPVQLGEDFTSTSTFKISGYEVTSGKLMIDATTNGKETDTQQFSSCHGRFKTEEIDGDIYFIGIYHVFYFLNGRGYTDPESYVVGEPAILLGRDTDIPYLGSFTRLDKVFDGWNTEKDGSGTDYEEGQEVRPTENLLLYGKWKDKFIVTYSYNGGSGDEDSSFSAPGYPSALPSASREGYRFMGWYEDESLKVFAGQAGEDYAADTDITLYAAWEKESEKPEERPEATIIFDADGGKMEGGDVTAETGDTITLPGCTKDGYEFTGWYDGDTCVGQAGDDYTVSRDVTLKAHYVKKEAPTCTVSFDTDGGKEISAIKVEKGQAVKLPEAEKDGYIFLGWHTAKEGGTRIDAEYTVTEDTTLYARWEKESGKPEEAAITFDADGGKMEGGNVTAKIGDTITLPGCTKDGYEFVGWYDGDTCTGQAGGGYTVSGDVTLKAHYVKKEAPTCTVSFDTDGGKGISPIKVEKGQSVKLPEAEKDGYIFLGWYTTKEGGTRIDAEYTVTEDTTLYARWEKEGEKPEEREEATITFDADGGEMEGGDITAKVGDTITLPNCTKDGYEFTGWYDGDTCIGQAGDDYTVTGNTTLKAHYEKKEEIVYLITFDPNGGRKAEHIRAAKGEKITLPGTEKNGYVFLGWYTEKKGGILLGLAGDEMEVTKDMTVYALWEREKAEDSGNKNPETCKAVFHTGGGTLKNNSVTIAKGTSLYLPIPEREGYDFTGWYLDKSLTQFAGAGRDSYHITKDIDFYAKWEKTASESSNNNSTADTGNSPDTDTKAGNSTDNSKQDTNPDKKADTATTGKPAATATSVPESTMEKEPVIQTGCTSPIYLLAALGMFGILLAVVSIRGGKRSSEE